MISVLIPIYNFKVSNLINALHEQLTATNIPFEIICLDDCSAQGFIEDNLKINRLVNTVLKFSEANNGRIKTRQLLSDQASYDWLLFLDADTLPKHNNFISNYLNAITSESEVILGGFAYKKESPKKENLLRWKYGKSCEEVKASRRNSHPYKIIISGNMLIKKEVFNMTNSKIIDKTYGLDSYFGSLLKQNNIKVLHIDNEVFHMGIEKSATYLKKKEEASDTLLTLLNENKIVVHNNNLLSWFLALKRFRLHYFFSYFFILFNSILKKNLLSSYPIITLLQFYRLSYMCYSYLKR